MNKDYEITLKATRSITIISILLFCFNVASSFAQDVDNSIQSNRYSLYYYQDGIDILEDYLDNARQIRRIRDILSRSPRIDSIAIYAYASPEGSPRRNDWLAQKRVEAARDFILANLPNDSVLLPENIVLHPMGENWDGLYKELEANYHLKNRDKVLAIMESKVSTETKKRQLRQLDNGITYNRIIKHHMPYLRMATWLCVYLQMPEFVLEEIPDMAIGNAPLPTHRLPAIPLAPWRKQYTILALKTNLLYDAATLLNYSLELPIGKRFSVLWYHQFPWWTWGEAGNEYCIRFLSIGGEARWWFKPEPRIQIGNRTQRDKLTGHFLGVYAESGKWDFEWQRALCHQGEHWSAGLSYGYAMPIGRRLNLELSLSLGYASIPFRKFNPSEDYEILWRDPIRHGRWHYFGPTKAQVSLVYPIVFTTKRGGGQ